MQSERFGYPHSIEAWTSDMDKVNYFLSARSYFILEPLHTLLLGIPENQKESVSCYPNPFSDEIHLSWCSDEEKVHEIAIYDVLGRKVFAQTVGSEKANETIIKPCLSAGVYVLKVGGHAQRIVRY